MKELYLYFFNRVKRDSIGLEASALSFTSILALIPAISVCFYIFAVFPSFEDVRESLKVFTKENFMPVFAETLGNYVGTFVEHSGKLTVTSTVVFFAISLLLVRSKFGNTSQFVCRMQTQWYHELMTETSLQSDFEKPTFYLLHFLICLRVCHITVPNRLGHDLLVT